jgi:hypothetical protein
VLQEVEHGSVSPVCSGRGLGKDVIGRSLPDEAIDAHLEQLANVPSDLSLMHLYPIDGAVLEVPTAATAWSARDATWSMVIAAIDADPGRAAEMEMPAARA